MKMRNLLFGVILSLFAVVHSTPLTIALQDDVYREAVTDGYLVAHDFAASLTTNSPKINTTVPASRPTSSESKDGGLVEGSGDSDDNAMFPRDEGDSNSESSATESPESGFTSLPEPNEAMTKDSDLMEASGDTGNIFVTSTFPQDGEDSSSESPTTESPQSGLTSSSEPNEAMPTESYLLEGSAEGVEFLTSTVSPQSQTTDPAVSTTDLLGSGSGSGSGLESVSEDITFTTITDTTAAAEIVPRFIMPNTAMNVVGSPKPQLPISPERTPSWIIIVGFIVGVAALVMLCVAIATRDKWNGPSQAYQVETQTNSSNQQRGLEMETFLQKEKPRENGKAAEYTVIPLDELPDDYSSH
ncbi:cell wall protein IFF6-like isoform X2 [Acanthopagrus latus]|uniref:cell wall protein IFF6-like isoform X2 n=1 Tax=Acanthopagrus latus TaxID=8177 RepID=UPI00187C0AB9|nr:cell wall protein IFF6-like isoform X2 [Acanthopagrus latus]